MYPIQNCFENLGGIPFASVARLADIAVFSSLTISSC